MKYLTLTLLWAASFAPSLAQATDIFWVRLEPYYYSYRDAELTCGGGTGTLTGPLFFVALVDNANRVTYADLRNSEFPYAQKQIVFTADEVAQIQVQKDVLKDYWVKSLPLSGRVARWLIYNMDPFKHCVPRRPITALGPQPAVLTFAPRESNTYYAQKLQIWGNKDDGNGFIAKFGFWQKMMLNP